MSLNQSLVGKQYGPFEPFIVTADHARAWAAATAGEGAVAVDVDDTMPPMMSVAFSYPVVGAVLFDPLLGVDMMRMLHGEQEMRFHAPVKIGDTVTTTATLASMAVARSGESLVVDIRSLNQHGHVVVDTRASLFMRGSRQRDAHDRDRSDRAAEAAAFDALPAGFVSDVGVAADQARRYADASGDHNPIHLDDDVAKQAGLPGCILHGLCVMAFVHDVVARHGVVRRLSVRFNRPVLVGDRLRIEGRHKDNGMIAVRVRNQAGIDVLVGVVAELV